MQFRVIFWQHFRSVEFTELSANMIAAKVILNVSPAGHRNLGRSSLRCCTTIHPNRYHLIHQTKNPKVWGMAVFSFFWIFLRGRFNGPNKQHSTFTIFTPLSPTVQEWYHGEADSSEHRSNTYVPAMYDGLGGQSAKTNGWKLDEPWPTLIPSNSTGGTLPGLKMNA